MALRAKKAWVKKGFPASVEIWVSPKGDRWYRLLLGPYGSHKEAVKKAKALKKKKKITLLKIYYNEIFKMVY